MFGGSRELTEVVDEMLSGFFPESDIELMTGYLTFGTRGYGRAVFIAGAVMLLSSGSAAFRTLEHTMADIHGTLPDPGARRIFLSFLWSVLFLAGIYISCAIMILGGRITAVLAADLGSPILGKIWLVIRFPILFVVLYFIILGTYVVTNPKSARGTGKGTGAFCAAVALVIVSALFAWGIDRSSRYDVVYGSIASVIILMIWFYICSLILITGNALNAVIAKRIK